MLIIFKINSRNGQFNIAYCPSFASIYIMLMAHFHRQRRTRIRTQIRTRIRTRIRIQTLSLHCIMHSFLPLVRIRIRIHVWRVSRMVTVPILGTDLRPRDLNPNPSPLVEMSRKGMFTLDVCIFMCVNITVKV